MLGQDLLLYYSFDGDSSSSLQDSSGNNRVASHKEAISKTRQLPPVVETSEFQQFMSSLLNSSRFMMPGSSDILGKIEQFAQEKNVALSDLLSDIVNHELFGILDREIQIAIILKFTDLPGGSPQIGGTKRQEISKEVVEKDPILSPHRPFENGLYF